MPLCNKLSFIVSLLRALLTIFAVESLCPALFCLCTLLLDIALLTSISYANVHLLFVCVCILLT